MEGALRTDFTMLMPAFLLHHNCVDICIRIGLLQRAAEDVDLISSCA